MSQENSSTGEVKVALDYVENLAEPGLDLDIDYNDASRKLISACLEHVPEVGTILSALVEILWPPTKKDVWEDIKGKAEAMINQKISDLVYQQVKEDLAGIKNNLDEYLNALKTSKIPTYISEKYNIVLGDILHDLPHFQSESYALPLLPLFAQLVNIHLSVLRDGYFFGIEKMGWSENEKQDSLTKLKNAIQSYTDYATHWFQIGTLYLEQNTPGDNSNQEHWAVVNKFRTLTIINAYDFAYLWWYFDPIRFPNPVKVYLDREIYSDPVGTASANEGGFYLYQKPPTKPITSLAVFESDVNDRWSHRHGKNFNGILALFPTGCGPDGKDQNIGTGKINYGGASIIDLTNKDITKVTCLAGKLLYFIRFDFSDGSSSQIFGGEEPLPNDRPILHTFSYPNQILSNIQIMGFTTSHEDFDGSANCAVFGFKFKDDSYQLDHSHLRTLYITAPNEMGPKKLAALSGVKDILTKADEIKGWIKNHRWDILREQHWNRLSKKVSDRNI